MTDVDPAGPMGRHPPVRGDETEAAARLGVGDRQRRLRRLWRAIPGPPRCKMCHRPFGSVGGPLMRLVGLGPWPGNPKYCRGCYRELYRRRTGAEVPCALLFADVRGSTSIAETMAPRAFRELMDRFYRTAFEVLVDHDAFVDKFVGDEVIGIFLPAMTNGNHARSAVEAGVDLLRATGHGDAQPWIPIGIGVNAGVAFVGAVGTEEHVEFTALGDVVNVAARLASSAGSGEILVTEAALGEAGAVRAHRERRSLELRGKQERIDAVVLTLAEL